MLSLTSPECSAVKGGADRLEICGNLVVGGGVTPSMGLVKCIQNVVDAPLMVRPKPVTPSGFDQDGRL